MTGKEEVKGLKEGEGEEGEEGIDKGEGRGREREERKNLEGESCEEWNYRKGRKERVKRGREIETTEEDK